MGWARGVWRVDGGTCGPSAGLVVDDALRVVRVWYLAHSTAAFGEDTAVIAPFLALGRALALMGEGDGSWWSTRTLGFASLLSLAACAGAPRPPTAEAVALRTAPAWHEAVYPSVPMPLVPVERGAGGDTATLWLLGGLRAEQRADRLEFADDLLAEPLIKSCRSDGGFLHISQASRLYWSSTFLGQLQAAGLAEELAAYRVTQCGPVTVAFGTRSLGYQILSRAGTRQLPTELTRVHFSSDAEGHALGTADQLLETHDGGRNFSAITARPAPAARSAEHLARCRIARAASRLGARFRARASIERLGTTCGCFRGRGDGRRAAARRRDLGA